METMTVVGKRPVKFKGQDGNEVAGTNFYVLCVNDYTEGHVADKIFISDNLKSRLSHVPKVGDEILVDFNRWGKISDITQMP